MLLVSPRVNIFEYLGAGCDIERGDVDGHVAFVGTKPIDPVSLRARKPRASILKRGSVTLIGGMYAKFLCASADDRREKAGADSAGDERIGVSSPMLRALHSCGAAAASPQVCGVRNMASGVRRSTLITVRRG